MKSRGILDCSASYCNHQVILIFFISLNKLLKLLHKVLKTLNQYESIVDLMK